MSKLYHNPRCSKSRAALEYLRANHIDFEVIEYLKTPLTNSELKVLCQKLSVSPKDIIRVKDQNFKELNIDSLINKSDDYCYELLVKHSRLMERPIYETTDNAAIGRPLENITDLI